MTATIRLWTIADVPAIRHIALTTWNATYGRFIPEHDIQSFYETYYTTEILGKVCSAQWSKGFLAEYENQPAGFAKTTFNPDENKFYLNSLYILPEYQHHGLGTRLLSAAEEFATSLCADEIWLGVMTQNRIALEWYKKIGFEFIREEPFAMGRTIVQHFIGFRTIKSQPRL